jgi:hypothetical protein
MNWRQLVTPLALVALIGGGVAVIVAPRPGVTRMALVDGGLLVDCVTRVATCDVRLSQGARLRLADAGYTLRPRQRYTRVSFETQACAAGGILDGVEPTLVTGAFGRTSPGEDDDDDEDNIKVLPGACQLRTVAQYGRSLGLRELVVETPGCKRRPGGVASCRFVDGGVPCERCVYQDWELTGAGCQGCGCTVFAGENPDEAL